MIFTDTDKLIKTMSEKWEYKSAQLERVLMKIRSMDISLQASFKQFLDNGKYPDTPSFFGLTPKVIAQNYPFKPPAVFLCLDWITRDPQNALDALVEEYKKPLPNTFDPELLKKYLASKKD